MADPYEGMTSEQLAEERRRLSEAAIGLQSIQRDIPQADVGEYGMAGLVSQMNPEARALDVERERKAQEIKAQQAALEAAVARSEEARRIEAARARVASAVGAPPSRSRTMEQALMEGGHTVGETPQGPTSTIGMGPQERQYKTVIGSRIDPYTNKIVFETQRVPVEDVPADLAQAGPMPAAEQWRAGALSENPMRAAMTSAYGGVNPSGQRSTGFQVRPGEGGFSPSAAIPPSTASPEEVLATQSPAVADLWFERKSRANEAAAQEARLKLGQTQVQISQEELKRIQDPTITVRERFALREDAKRRLLAERGDQIEQQVLVAIDAVKASGQQVTPQLEAVIRSSVTDKLAGEQALDQMIAQAMSGEPAVAASRFRPSSVFP